MNQREIVIQHRCLDPQAVNRLQKWVNNRCMLCKQRRYMAARERRRLSVELRWPMRTGVSVMSSCGSKLKDAQTDDDISAFHPQSPCRQHHHVPRRASPIRTKPRSGQHKSTATPPATCRGQPLRLDPNNHPDYLDIRGQVLRIRIGACAGGGDWTYSGSAQEL